MEAGADVTLVRYDKERRSQMLREQFNQSESEWEAWRLAPENVERLNALFGQSTHPHSVSFQAYDDVLWVCGKNLWPSGQSAQEIDTHWLSGSRHRQLTPKGRANALSRQRKPGNMRV